MTGSHNSISTTPQSDADIVLSIALNINILTLYLFVSGLLTAGLILYARLRCHVDWCQSLLRAEFGVLVWTVSHLLLISVDSVRAQAFWFSVETMAKVWAIYVFYRFLYHFIHRRPAPFLSRSALPVAGLPMVISLLVLTNSAHHLMWSGIEPTAPGLGPQVYYGVGFWLFKIYSYAVLVYCVHLCVDYVTHGNHRFTLPAAFSAFLVSGGVMLDMLYVLVHRSWMVAEPSVVVVATLSPVILWLVIRGYEEEVYPLARATAFAQMTEGALVLDPDWALMDANPAAQTMLDIDTGRDFGSPVEQMFERSLDNLDLEQLRHMGEVECVTRGGQAGEWLQLRLSPLHDRMGETGAQLLIMQNITRLKEAAMATEAARQSAEENARIKGEFLTNISHEIRTPMNAMIGMTSLLLETDLSQEQREYVETIRAGGDALLDIVNSILDFSHIDAQATVLERQPYSLLHSVEDVLELCAAQFPKTQVELLYEMSPDVPDTVFGDATRFRQVLVNLVSNALKFTRYGEIAVRISLAPGQSTPAAGDMCEVQIRVSDTGIGIPADRMDRLFHSFAQADASLTRRHGGAGIGLATCRRLVEQMGGKIWVESKEGAGSIFRFTMVVEAGNHTSLAFQSIFSRRHFEERTVFLAIPNPALRTMLARWLENWGLLVIMISSMDDLVWELTNAPPPDLIIMDARLAPSAEMLTLCTSGEENTPPFVLVGSPTHLDGIFERLQLTVTKMLAKPVQIRSFYAAIADILNTHEQQPIDQPVGTRIGDMATQPACLDKSTENHPAPAEGALAILIVEDNRINQRVSMQILKRLGYQADVAANGREALDALARQRYDLVLMDVQMPVMDGLEATRLIRTRYPAETQPYIIALTAGATVQDRQRCLHAGMDAYLSKPITMEALDYALQQALTALGEPAESLALSL